MLELTDEKVQFKRGFRFHGVELWHDDVGQRFAEMTHLLGALLLVRFGVKLHKFALEASNLCECLADGECGFRCAAAFQHCRQHVKPLFGECLVVVLGVPAFAALL